MTATHTLTTQERQLAGFLSQRDRALFSNPLDVVHVYSCIDTRTPYVRLINDDGRGVFPVSINNLRRVRR